MRRSVRRWVWVGFSMSGRVWVFSEGMEMVAFIWIERNAAQRSPLTLTLSPLGRGHVAYDASQYAETERLIPFLPEKVARRVG